jgi:hypothetical protein
MTAKEKAQELYIKMLEWQDHADVYIDRKIISTSAKKCALIAVHEIIKEVDLKMYWQEVKQEIQKL